MTARKNDLPNEKTTAPAASPHAVGDRALAAFWTIFFLAFWGWRYQSFLFAVGENSLFLTRSDFFLQWLGEPAGALGYAAAFFIQFCRWPILGAAILTAFGVAITLWTARLFELKGAARVFAAIPTLALAVAATWHGCHVYNSANVTLVFSGYLAALLTLASLAAARRMSPGWLSTIVLCVLCAPGYFLFGVWSCATLILCALDSKVSPGRHARLRLPLFLVVALVVPMLSWCFLLFDRLPRVAIFTLGLFDPMIEQTESSARYFVMFGTAAAPLFWIVVAMLTRIRNAIHARAKNDRSPTRAERRRNRAEKAEDVSAPKPPRNERRLTFELALIFAVVACALAYHRSPFFAIMAQNRALDRGDWEEIIRIDSRVKRPIPYNVALRNVALFERGELAERAFERPIAGLAVLPFSSEEFEFMTKSDPGALKKLTAYQKRAAEDRAALSSTPEIILCRYGLPNLATRSIMNKRAVCRGRSAYSLKVLAYCVIVNGERDLAERYLRELRDAPVQRSFVRLCDAFLASEDFDRELRDEINDKTYDHAQYATDAEPTPALSLVDAALNSRVSREELERFANGVLAAREMRPRIDVKKVDVFPDLARLYDVFPDEFEIAPRRARDAELVAALMHRGDLKTPGDDFFMKNIETYAKEYGAPLPKALEQGYALLKFRRNGANWDMGEYKFSPETKSAFGEYADFLRQVGDAIHSRDAQDGVRNFCAGTYWGYAEDDSAFIQF